MATGRAPTEVSAPIGIAILAKAPIPGFAKTRLIPLLGGHVAAALQEWLLKRIVATARAAALGPVTLWCAPDCTHPAFLACREAGGETGSETGLETGQVRLRRQPDGDLGARMQAAAADAGPTLILGTDCPQMTVADLRAAAAALGQGNDAVLVPADDGGYLLLGIREFRADLFEGIDWSTPAVLAQTRRRLSAAGWRWHELSAQWDIDRPEDVARLVDLCPELAAILREGSSATG